MSEWSLLLQTPTSQLTAQLPHGATIKVLREHVGAAASLSASASAALAWRRRRSGVARLLVGAAPVLLVRREPDARAEARRLARSPCRFIQRQLQPLWV